VGPLHNIGEVSFSPAHKCSNKKAEEPNEDSNISQGRWRRARFCRQWDWSLITKLQQSRGEEANESANQIDSRPAGQPVVRVAKWHAVPLFNGARTAIQLEEDEPKELRTRVKAGPTDNPCNDRAVLTAKGEKIDENQNAYQNRS